MKLFKIILTFLVPALIISCSNDNVKIDGTIAAAEEQLLYLQHVKADKTVNIDSVKLKRKGTFTLKTNTETTGFYQLKLKKGGSISLLITAGDKVHVTAHADSLVTSTKITGSPESEKLLYLNRNLAETRLQIKKIYDNPEGTDQELTAITKAHRKNMIGFILENTNSLTSVSAIYQQYYPNFYVFNTGRDIQYFKILTDSLTKYHPNSPHVIALKQNTANMVNSYSKARLNKIIAEKNPGNRLPNIKMTDNRGDSVNFYDINKTVLLTFWDHNDENSVKYNLQLQPVYEKYRNKGFEIVQISIANDSIGWQRAVAYDELDWINLWGRPEVAGMAASYYNVTSIPRSLLITSDKTNILGSNISALELDKKLNQLLN